MDSRTDEFKLFDWNKLNIGSKLHALAVDARDLIRYSSEHEIFPRNDNNHLVNYLGFYFGIESEKLTNFKIFQLDVCREARFIYAFKAAYVLRNEFDLNIGNAS